MTTYPLAIIAAAVLTACSPDPSAGESPINWDDYAFPDAGPPAPPQIMWVCLCSSPFGGDAYRRDIASPLDLCDVERWRDVALEKICPAYVVDCHCICTPPEPSGDAGAVDDCGGG